jgi:hypothetical protein
MYKDVLMANSKESGKKKHKIPRTTRRELKKITVNHNHNSQLLRQYSNLAHSDYERVQTLYYNVV